jgi:hypothetical protein
MYITSFNVNYKLNISLNLPNDMLNKISEITFVNHILNRFVKGYFRRNTYAALLQSTVKLILFTLCYKILILV